MGWGRCSCSVITGEVGTDLQSYGWSSCTVLSCTPVSSGEKCSAALSPQRAHRLFTTEGSSASEYCLHLSQRKGPKNPIKKFHETSSRFSLCISFRKKPPTVQTVFFICSQRKDNPPWEGEIRRTAILLGNHCMRIGKHSSCLEAQSAPLTASSVCSVAQHIPLEANTTWRD